MRPDRQLKTICVILIFLCIASIQGENASSSSITSDNLQNKKVFEGKLDFNRKLAVNMEAGNGEYNNLIKIESIGFDTSPANAWEVTALIDWLPVIDSAWKIKTELLDESGRVLHNSCDEDTNIICKSSKNSPAEMSYAKLNLDAMQCQGRRHASRFRITIEPVDLPLEFTESSNTKTYSLDATVVELENNKPLSGATLVVISTYRGESYHRYKTIYVTDEQGHCEIKLAADKLDSVNIQVHKQGFALMEKSWSSPGSEFFSQVPLVNLPDNHIFEMLPACAIGGIVKDKNGNTIEGVIVHIEAYFEDQCGINYLSQTKQTDAQGRWRVEGVPSETDRISIGLRHPDYGGDHVNNRYIRGDALSEAKAFKLVEILEKGITVTGKVLDENGEALSDATVMVAQRGGNPFYDITNSKGEYKFVCSGDRKTYDEKPSIVVEAPGFAPQARTIDIDPNNEPQEFRMTRGKTIKCRVVDNEGNPVVGARTVIEPFFPDNKEYDNLLKATDENGEFEIPNAPNRKINLTVLKTGYIELRNYVLEPDEEIINIPMKRALTVLGKVIDSQTGNPVPYFEITPSFSSGNRNNVGGSILFADGKYELRFERASSFVWQFTVSALGYQAAVSESIGMEEGQYVMDFKLRKGPGYDVKTAGQLRKLTESSNVHRITGVVRDESGTPVPGTIVTTRPAFGLLEPLTSTEGKFMLRLRNDTGPVGEVFIFARHKEKNLAAAVKYEETKDNYDIELSKGVIFTGKVVDVNNNGIPNAKITLVSWLGDSGFGVPEPTKIDSEGNFEIRAIPRGLLYSVQAKAEGFGQKYIRVSTSEAVNDFIKLEPLVLEVADLPTTGYVVDEYEQPVPNIRIYAYGNGQPNQETYTDARGKFALEKICKGQLSIQANQQNPIRLSGSVTVQGGDQNVKIVVNEMDESGRAVQRTLPSLVGKPLPDFKNIKTDLSSEQLKDKRVLVCFWDIEQRPSRHCVTELAKEAEILKQKNIVVVLIHLSKIEKEKLDEWLKQNNISFYVGINEAEELKTKFTWGIKSLPWLILTDENHIITDEGFSINELDDNIENGQNQDL